MSEYRGTGDIRSDCSGKHPFESQNLARKVAGRMPSAKVYRCPHCHKYHIGHALKPKRRPPAPLVSVGLSWPD